MRISSWFREHFGGGTPPENVTPDAKKLSLSTLFEPLLHPQLYQNKRLLRKIGIQTPTESMYKNKMLMKTLRDFLHASDAKEMKDRMRTLQGILAENKTDTDEQKLAAFLKSRNIITDADYSEIVERLQVGDVIACFSHESTSKIDAAIRSGQHFVKPLMRHTTSDSHNATHLMIVVSVDKKNQIIKVAEATPDKRKHDVRILSFKYSDFKLRASVCQEYRIYHTDNQILRERAAEVAQYFAEEKVYVDEDLGTEKGHFMSPTTHHYSKKKAVKALFSRANFSSKEAKDAQEEATRFLEQKRFKKSQTSESPACRRFFCAELIGFSYLTAEISLRQEKAPNLTLAKGWEKSLITKVRASRMTPQKFVTSHDLLGFQQTVRIIPKFTESRHDVQ